MSYKIRRANINDLSEVTALLKEEILTCDGVDYGILTSFIKEVVEGRNNRLCYIVVKDDGEAIGFITLTLSNRIVYIDDFGVTKEERNKGVGSHLLKAILVQLKSRGVATVNTRVNPSNGRAIRLYERFGFTPTKYEGNSFILSVNMKEFKQ